MKHNNIFLPLSIFILLSLQAFPQASLYFPYTFSTSANSTTLPTTNAMLATQDEGMAVITPGFNFPCGGRTYSNFLISSNGWMALLPSAAIPAYFATPLPNNDLAGYAGGTPLIAPMWDDIFVQNVNWSIVGTNLLIRWNARIPKNSTGAHLLGVILSSTTGSITFVYPNLASYNMNGNLINSASIGFASGCGEFYSVTPLTSTTATSSDLSEFKGALTQANPLPNITGTAGNSIINVSSTAGIIPGMYIGGTGVSPSGNVVGSIGAGLVNATVNNTAAVSGVGNFYIRPNNVNYIYTPSPTPNDVCGFATATPLGSITGTCAYVTGTNIHATTSLPAPSCAVVGTDVKDVWYSFIKPAGITGVTITTAPASCPMALTGTTIELYVTCGGAPIVCSSSSIANPTYGALSASRPCVAETLYVRVVGDNNTAGKFQICATSSVVPNLGFTCSSAESICSLPASLVGNTAGAGNDYDSTNAVCHTLSMNGEDYVYTYTPTFNECVTITGTTGAVSIGISVYNGCPDSSSGSATYCLRTAESITGSATITSVTMTAGVTYYIVIDSQTGSIPYTLNVSSGGGTPSNDLCVSATNLGTIASGVSCGYTTYTTACATPSAVGIVPIPSCVPNQVPRAFNDGVTGDVWLRFAAGYTGTLQIATVQSAANPTANAAMSVYTGSCASPILYACDYNSGTNGMPLLSIPVTNGTTYFIRLWTENPENAGQFDICFSNNCAPPNDLPCAGVYVPLASTTTGYNTCAGLTGEPLNAAQCVAGGTINTVWYKAVVPASGQVHVRTHPLTLSDTQIQAYTSTGGCGSVGTFISRGCNDDGPSCSGGFSDFSDLNVTGLPVGDTLYIAVDGTTSLTGSFEISIIDGTTPDFPPVYQQDCAGAQLVCSTSDITVADPGFRNYGNICDMPTSASTCWGIGERNSVWYTFTTNGVGKVKFDILTPNTIDLDFLLWDVTGVANPCSLIKNSPSLLPNVACNYSGSTTAIGLMDPPLVTGYGNAVNVTGTRTFILLINSFNSGSNAGFYLNWQGTPIAATSTVAIWNGGTTESDTSFSCSTCWGDCGTNPTCGIDATVNPTTNLRQPTVSTNQSVRDITINAGATLRIKAGITLSVCGNFTNNGTLICEPGSTVLFQLGAASQAISGNLTGTNGFANLVIDKSAGFVILNSNIDVREDFTTSTITSQFNINGKYMKVGGDFTNNTSNTTFTGIGGSTVEFNGSNNQFLTNVNNIAGITMNHVIMNKSGGKLYLNSSNSSLRIDSVLTLNSGIISTRNDLALQVFAKWGNSAAIVGHNALSYIDGKLRRGVYTGTALTLPYSLDFPVGDSLSSGGYEMANVTFTSFTVIPDIQAFFSPWPTIPPVGPVAVECNGATYNQRQLLDHGYWTFSKSSTTPFNGSYQLTMNNIGYTNSTGGLSFTVANASDSADPGLAASWSLIGQCSPSSTASITQRVNINGTNPYLITTTLGSNVIYTSNTSNLSVGAAITGAGIPGGSVITGIPDFTSFTISIPATATGTVTGSIGSPAASTTSFNHLYAIAVNETNPLQAIATLTSTILCNDGQGAVQVSANGGTPPYTGIGTFNVNAGTYLFTVTDSNGNTASTSIVVSEPAELISSSIQTAVLCNGGTSSITISAVGGTSPYTGIGSFTVEAGTYSYIVSDANGCLDTIDVIINEPIPLVASATSSPVLCFGETSNILVSAAGGTTPYIGTGSYTEGQGSYSYIVTDLNSCADTVEVTISQPAPVLISINASPIICNDDSSTVVVSANGGTAPYSGVGAFNFAQGTHNISVTDANGCVSDTTIIITDVNPLTVTINQTSQILCNGGTANINVTASGGNGPYTGIGIFQVTAGSHTFTVADFNGCVAIGNITIIQPSPFIATATLITPILCKGGSATISITTTGGASNYSAIFNATAGVQNYTVIDANGCPSTASITLTEPDSLQTTVSYLPLTCFGGTTTVLVSAFGGTSPYNGIGSFNVGAGTHTFLVSDANGCVVSKSITIVEPQQIIVNASPGTINCFGGTTTVVVSATGGLSPYSGTGNFLAGSGVNNFTVTDANGCTSSTSVELLSPSQLIASSIQTSTITCSGGLANILVSATGGIGPYSGTGTFSAVAGTHVYNISDANGCAASTVIVIGQPSLFVATASITTPIQCHGGSAIVTVTTTGGTSNYSASYTVTAGSHNYTIIDANGCSSTASITVTQPDSLKMLSSYLPINCYGESTSVNISATGGIAPYIGVGNFTVAAGTQTFTVTDANGCVVNNSLSLTQPSQLIVNVSAGTINCNGGVTTVSVSASGGTPGYTGVGTFTVGAGTHNYVVTDANGCSANATAEVTQSGIPVSVSITEIIPISCNGELATLLVGASGGAGTYTGTGTFIVSAGTHSYTVTDSNGCTGSGAIAITEPSLLSVNLTSIPIQCYGGLGTITITATGGTSPYEGVSSFLLLSGEHTFVVTDANNCSSSVTTTLNQPAKVEGTITTTSSGCSGITGTATVFPTGGVGPYSYLWSDGQTNSNAIGLQAGPYSVIITDANNCTGSVSTTIINEGTLPPTPSTISGPTSLCRNSIGVVFTIAPVVGANSYVWTLPNGVSGSSTTNSITISISSTYVGGFICVAAVNACGIGSASCKNVPVITTYPSRPTIIVGSAVTCGPSIFTYSTTGNNASSFSWSITGTGATILSGQGSNTIQVSIPTGFTQGSIQVYATNCYGNSSSRGMTITGIPVHSNSVTGPSFICANNSATYTMPLVTGVAPSNYIWSVTGDAVVTSSTVSAVASSATINFGSNWTSGIVTINVLNSCGSHARSFTVRSVPTQPGSITGPNTGLCNLTGVSYSVGAVANATSYTWTVPPGATIASTSPNGQSIVVDFSPAFTSNSANICVTANNGCGVGTARCYVVTSRLAAPLITGPTSVCQSQSNVAYSIVPMGGAVSYAWTASDNGIITPSSNSANVNFNLVTNSTSTIRANVINACGASPLGSTIVSVNNTCREIGESQFNDQQIKFSPNPVSEKGMIEINSIINQKCIIRITDILGNELSYEMFYLIKGVNSEEIDFSNYPSGVYFLKVVTEDETMKTIKVVVQ